MSKVRVAQIGVSAIHAPMYRDSLVYLADEAEIVGFWDPQPDSEATRSRIKPDVAHVPFFGTIDELLSEAKPDAVLISGTMAEMPAWIEQAAAAGVHIWAEKPFAVHSSQLLPAKAAIEANDLVFSCGYSWRFEPLSLIIKDAIDDGLLGKPYGFDIRFHVQRRLPKSGALDVRSRPEWRRHPELARLPLARPDALPLGI